MPTLMQPESESSNINEPTANATIPSIIITNADGTRVVIPFAPMMTSSSFASSNSHNSTEGSQVVETIQPQIQLTIPHDILQHQQHQQQRNHVRVSYNVNRTNTTAGAVLPTVPPLEPQVVTRLHCGPTATATTTTATTATETTSANNVCDSDDEWHRFKCAICYEFMNEPSGCGSCGSRFCHLCLERCRRQDLNIIRREQAIARSTSSDIVQQQRQEQGQQLPKCPTCRQPYHSVVRDEELEREMIESGPEVTCRFDGCTEVLRLQNISNHERTCIHVPVHCRYAPYGCSWTGKRGDVPSHENSGDCSLAKISTFLQEYRKTKADHISRLQVVSQQASAALRSSAVTQQNLFRQQQKSIYDVVSVFQFVYLVVCSTPFLLRTLNTWASYLTPIDRVGSVVNTLTFLPLMLISFVIASHGIVTFIDLTDRLQYKILKIVYNQTSTSTSFWNRENEDLLAELVLGLCAGILGSMLVMINFLDSKSSLTWQTFQIKYLGKPPIVSDLLALACFTQVMLVLEYFHGGWKALILWLCLAASTIIFPSTVWVTSNRLVQRPIPVASIPRCAPQIYFGLRYGLLATICDVAPCLDSIIAFILLPRSGTLAIPTFFRLSTNCFLDNLPKSLCWAYVGLRLSYPVAFHHLPVLQAWIEGHHSASNCYKTIFAALIDLIIPSTICTLLLLAINSFFYALEKIGVLLSERIIAKTNVTSTRNQVLPADQQKDYTGVGILTFSFWVLTLAMIIHF